eukprot:SAG25_NODE_2860_length_1346_cov_1.565357_1_plen_29_part_10
MEAPGQATVQELVGTVHTGGEAAVVEPSR